MGCNLLGYLRIHFQQTNVIVYILNFYIEFGVKVGRAKIVRVVFGRLFLDEWFEGSLIEKIYGFLLNAEEIANQMIPTFEQYPYWRTSEEHERNFKRELLKIFSNNKFEPKKSIELTNKILTILKGENT